MKLKEDYARFKTRRTTAVNLRHIKSQSVGYQSKKKLLHHYHH